MRCADQGARAPIGQWRFCTQRTRRAGVGDPSDNLVRERCTSGALPARCDGLALELATRNPSRCWQLKASLAEGMMGCPSWAVPLWPLRVGWGITERSLCVRPVEHHAGSFAPGPRQLRRRYELLGGAAAGKRRATVLKVRRIGQDSADVDEPRSHRYRSRAVRASDRYRGGAVGCRPSRPRR